MRVLRKGPTCEYEGCERPATEIAAGRKSYSECSEKRHGGVGVYCSVHALMVADEGRPEYTVDCPNCGCAFGVN